MTPLLTLLTSGLPDGAWRIDHFGSVRHSLVASFGRRVVVVDIDLESDKASLLQQLATRLRFPEWFGHNWDALHDVMSDLADRSTPLPSSTYPFNAGDLLVLRLTELEGGAQPSAPSSDVETMIDIVSDVARAPGLCVLIAGGPIGVGGLPELSVLQN